MGSTRLPGKILRDFAGKTLLEHIICRLKSLRKPVKTVIATSVLPQDDITEIFCQTKGVLCFRGSEDNVLERYCQCAEKYNFSHIVRMTGDNPFPDIEELARLIEYHQSNDFDFSENFSVLPIGVGMEIISFKALQISMEKADLPKHFEHPDEYVLDNIKDFRHGTLGVKKEKNFPAVRLTVDTEEDYQKACWIIKKAGKEYVTTELAIRLSAEYEGLL